MATSEERAVGYFQGPRPEIQKKSRPFVLALLAAYSHLADPKICILSHPYGCILNPQPRLQLTE